MTQTDAQRQKAYRQRQALAKVRNEYTVTLMLQACEKAGIDIWPTIVDCAQTIFTHNGDALEFVRRIAPLAYAVATTRIIMDKVRSRPGGDRHQDET
jgi:hypothetical protein